MKARIANITNSALDDMSLRHLEELSSLCDGHNSPEGFTQEEITKAIKRRVDNYYTHFDID